LVTNFKELKVLPVSESQNLMTPAEVAALFRVDPKTVTRWADAGKMTAVRTLGGHRRYRRDEVQNLLAVGSISSVETGQNSNESPSD
jgi:excisionase family DNA binding protein